MEIDTSLLNYFKPILLEQILRESSAASFTSGTEILRAEQYVKVLPIVLSGLVKVYTRFDEKELMLYYIEPSQSCVMTFYAALKNTPSKIYAVVEEDAELLLIPAELVPKWIKEFPDFNEVFYGQFNLRYSELLETIGHLLVDKMDKRVYDHLKKKSSLTNNQPVRISHNQLATELGTAREVVTRMLKKLENQGKIRQDHNGLQIIGEW